MTAPHKTYDVVVKIHVANHSDMTLTAELVQDQLSDWDVEAEVLSFELSNGKTEAK